VTARRDLAESVEAAEREIDAMWAPLAPTLRRSIERHAQDGKITHIARRAILRDVDAILDQVFGRQRGDHSVIGELVVRQANQARFKPVEAAVQDIRDWLKDEPLLRSRIELSGTDESRHRGAF
jgi:hypothetical protein